MRTLVAVRRLIAVVLLAWHVPACSTGWQTRPVVPQENKRTVHAGDVRVTTTDGTVHAFRGMWVSADSLGGWLTEPTGVERAFPLNSVATVQVRHQRGSPSHEGSRVSGGKVLGLIVVLSLALGAIATFPVAP